MKTYLIAHIEVTNPDLMAKYREQVPAIVEKYNGKYLVRGGESKIIEGDYFKHRIVRYWKNIGIVDVGKYDKEMEYVFYMTKHINKTKFNNWDILSNL